MLTVSLPFVRHTGIFLNLTVNFPEPREEKTIVVTHKASKANSFGLFMIMFTNQAVVILVILKFAVCVTCCSQCIVGHFFE